MEDVERLEELVMYIVCVRIAGIENINSINEYMSYLKFLSKEKGERLSRFSRKDDFLRSLVADLLIRLMLVKNMNLSNMDIRISSNSYGKPFIQGHSVEFNVSHSGEWVTAVISQSPVGIDVEKIRPIDLDIAKKIFTEKEYADIVAKNDKERNEYFFDLWTLKESYIKAYGHGLSIPLDSFSFSVKDQNISFENNHSQEHFYFRQYQVHSQYKLAACSSHSDFPQEVIIWNLREILDDAKRLLESIS
ncbi:4'-phosphopantetheinyl transferase family protein [Paenibacillus tianjinensis]|uniref:4'-phosphopantetheinyl transferase superfamily protein n=1 Tax=Paenibacillus tianjinensis TaxID=2810347 RepID=A0ABX7LDM3_9BACL|nr:4'-phosphopantetheinyl transferase superfamily protein [Paenibacillus tianjinensis]QSF46223.1 4'-phosphopantetheinyl transferase superfamily protein [Paenibacillus tianjinensis]